MELVSPSVVSVGCKEVDVVRPADAGIALVAELPSDSDFGLSTTDLTLSEL